MNLWDNYDYGIEYMHIRIAEILLDRIRTKKDDMLITYKDLSHELDGEVHEHQLGKFLGVLSSICLDMDLPPISAIVVKTETKMPGAGFFKEFCPKDQDKDVAFMECYNRIKDVEEDDGWVEFEERLNLI